MAYDPVKRVDELTLRCRGSRLGSGKPIVVCAVDWIGIANEGQDAFRDALAEAAGTTRRRVAVHPSTSTTPRAAISPPSGSSRKWARRITAASKGRFTARVIQRRGRRPPRGNPQGGNGNALRVGRGRSREIRLEPPDQGTRRPHPRHPLYRHERPRPPHEPEGVIDPQVCRCSRSGMATGRWRCPTTPAIRKATTAPAFPAPIFPVSPDSSAGRRCPKPCTCTSTAGGNLGGQVQRRRQGKPHGTGDAAGRMKQAFLATEKQPLAPPMSAGRPSRCVCRWRAPGQGETHGSGTKTEPARRHIAKLDQLAGSSARSGHAIDIACLRVGQARVVHMPGELFVEYQLAAKACDRTCMSPWRHMENTPRLHRHRRRVRRRGYETSSAATSPRSRPGPHRGR